MPIFFQATPTFLTSITDDGIGTYVTEEQPATQPVTLGSLGAAKTVDLTRHLKAAGVDDDGVLLDELRDDGGFSHLVSETSGDYMEIGGLYVRFDPAKEWPTPLMPINNPYELLAIYFSADDTKYSKYARQRYHAFHAEVTSVAGPLATVKVWPAAGAADDFKELTIDRSAPLQCAAAENLEWWPSGWGRITLLSPKGATGALFLSANTADEFGVRVPKLPKALGDDSAPVGNALAAGNPRAGTNPKLETQPPQLPTIRPCEVCRMLEPAPVGKKGGRPARRLRQPGSRTRVDERSWTTLNVSGIAPTTGLIDVQARLQEGKNLALVKDLPALLDLLRQAAACRPPRARRRLDLVAHTATKDALLRLGRSLIDMRDDTVVAIAQQIAEEHLLARLGIQEVRIIGCSSSRTEAAKETMRALHDVLQVPVSGVCDLLTLGEFEPASFAHDTVGVDLKCGLFRWPAATHRRFVEEVGTSQHAARALETVVLHDSAPTSLLAPGGDLVRWIGNGRGREMHGFLAEPVRHVIVVPPAWTGTYQSFDVFFDHSVVAAYPGGVPVFYEVDNPAELEATLSECRPVAHGKGKSK